MDVTIETTKGAIRRAAVNAARHGFFRGSCPKSRAVSAAWLVVVVAGISYRKLRGVMFTYVPAHDELSSNVVGLDVYNKDKQNIGTIKDIALDANGLNGYSVNVGDFLGMGDHYVVVRPSAMSFNAKDNKWHATMNVTADQLKAAPEYKYSSNSRSIPPSPR
jgi:hypothetical protein